jgi:hypothetical protein
LNDKKDPSVKMPKSLENCVFSRLFDVYTEGMLKFRNEKFDNLKGSLIFVEYKRQ